jgi:uridylate kinase
MAKKQTLVISLGGSTIVPNEIDVEFLKEFSKLIFDFAKNRGRVVIVAGGGFTNRKYNEAVQKIVKASNLDLDWLGIAATKLNAELLRVIFGEKAHLKVVINPTEKIKTSKKIIIGAGWMPGCSSDNDAVLWAKNLGAKTVINLTNIDYIYDKDPRQYKDAKPFKILSWKEYKKIVGGKWVPRMHAPFDPVASRLAEKLGLKVIIMKAGVKNLKNFLENKEFVGSILGEN